MLSDAPSGILALSVPFTLAEVDIPGTGGDNFTDMKSFLSTFPRSR